jgi:hypothetical protein
LLQFQALLLEILVYFMVEEQQGLALELQLLLFHLLEARAHKA